MEENKTVSPFFSVIVPAYNNEREIKKCINSILSQTFEGFELILVDDGSNDSTPEICDWFAEQDGRVKVLHTSNRGVASARNEGLFCAKGRYVYYVDGDDWIAPELLQEAEKILDVPEPPDIFIFGYTMILENGKSALCDCPFSPGMYYKDRLENEVYPKMMLPLGIASRTRFVSSSLCDKVIVKKLLDKHYCKDTSLFACEDLVCAYECMYFAEKVYFSPKNMYFYNRYSSSTMHQRYHEDLLDNNKAAASYLRKHLGGRADHCLDRQINKIEFDGWIGCVYQEIQFSPSLWRSAGYLKEKIKQTPTFLVCRMDGLSFFEQCYTILLSFRLVYPTLLVSKLCIWLLHILNR